MQVSKLKPWQVVSTKVVHTTPWIEVVEDLCKIDATSLTYTYTRRVDEGPLIIAEAEDNKIWLVRQYRHAIKKIIWQFPVEGKLVAESWEAAAQRGLEEELGLHADRLVELGTFYPDPGGLEQKYKAFVATGLHPSTAQHSDPNLDEVEQLEAGCFSLQEVEQLITEGEICDNWTLSGLFLYRRYRHSLGL